MTKNQKTCIILAMFLVFLMPGYASSNEEKIDLQSALSNKAQTGLVFPWTQWEFSMDVPRSNPQIDSKTVEITFGPTLSYKPIFINPYTKKEITGYSWPPLGSFQQELQLPWTDEKYSMNLIRPNPNIDRKILKNTFDPNIDCKLRVINPYTKKESTGYNWPPLGSFQQEFSLSWIDKKYSMRVLRANPNIDSAIVKNTFNPNIDYKLRVINPYAKKEITNFKGPYLDLLQDKFQPEGKRYKTPMTSPVK